MTPRKTLQEQHPSVREDGENAEEDIILNDSNMVIRHTEGTFALILVEGEYYEGPY
jgi:hypothetical protein